MIELVNVSKHFPSGKAVDAVSLHVDEGELLVLLGESGCGKTTTLKMINRLIEPTSGHILLDGRAIAAEQAHLLRRRIGYVFQKVGLFPHMSVAENISVTPTLQRKNPSWIRSRVDALLSLVELDPAETRDRWPSELSGGEQQRVGVARALAAEPRVMLLDEPFGALDPITRDRLQRSFLDIRRRLGLTAIFVTHDMVEALLLGDRIAVMRNGSIDQLGKPAELMKHPANDYVEQLMNTPRRQAKLVDELIGESS